MIIGTRLVLIKIIVCVTASEIDELVINSDSNKAFISLVASDEGGRGGWRRGPGSELASGACDGDQQGTAAGGRACPRFVFA